MPAERVSLLNELEADLRVEDRSLTILLQKCLLLGGRSGSDRLRVWARQELNGYFGDGIEVPEHRRVGSIIKVNAVVGYTQITGQSIPASHLPKVLRDNDVDEVLELRMGVGELEDWVRRDDKSIKLSQWKSADVVALMNAENPRFGQQITDVYWEVSTSAIHNVLMLVRTKMVDLVAELLAVLPDDETVPGKELVDDAVGVIVYGEHNHITVVQSRADAAPVVASGANGTAIGSQTSGDHSSVTGNQVVQGNDNKVTGHDTTITTNDTTMTDSTGNITVGSSDVRQEANSGLDTTEVLTFIGFVRQSLPVLGIEQSAQEGLVARIGELHREADSATPDRRRLCELLGTVLDGLRLVDPTVVRTIALDMGDEALKTVTGT
ncbi:hypothetical protein SAMN05216553_110295 [Lentzea fradiae]|uniref:AbiTii domain-containing protein n=1 Tax=Lentzea fradiae TaxID=200378 RepID=A0A1G7WD62_9PSEU|nr:hypothetical protein [Lentzea fradiae]SDG69729.1 hypothetical protein SAMN05216553_110295 [Lentzea fradiae]